MDRNIFIIFFCHYDSRSVTSSNDFYYYKETKIINQYTLCWSSGWTLWKYKNRFQSKISLFIDIHYKKRLVSDSRNDDIESKNRRTSNYIVDASQFAFNCVHWICISSEKIWTQFHWICEWNICLSCNCSSCFLHWLCLGFECLIYVWMVDDSMHFLCLCFQFLLCFKRNRKTFMETYP